MTSAEFFLIARAFLDTHIRGFGHDFFIEASILASIALGAVVCYYLTKLLMLGVEWFVGFTETTWDDDMLNDRFNTTVSQLTPALVVKYMLQGFYGMHHFILHAATTAYIVVVLVFIIYILMDNFYDALLKRPRMRYFAVKGIFQMVKLVIGALAVIYIAAYLAKSSPWKVLTAIGAAATVIMFIFQNTLLGLVASIQLSANKMLHRGDWIISDKHSANGEVIEISLTTVKVRNWDNSITTIPPYSLVNEAFRNYQPMRDSGGRRVDRSITIDVNSVRFLDDAELQRLRDKGWLEDLDIDTAARHINLRLLRLYLEAWLTANNRVRSDLLLMVRQMEPTKYGLPLQLYFFTDATVWKEYEKVQSDIFDHVYAIVREFGLSIYQQPAADDIRAVAR